MAIFATRSLVRPRRHIEHPANNNSKRRTSDERQGKDRNQRFRQEGGSRLFRWVALLIGSKNALQDAGFFAGAALLELSGFSGALGVLAGMLLVLLVTAVLLQTGVGKMPADA